VKPKGRLLSWKQAPPHTAPERATARLLEELRSAPTLSPEAFARIERRLRTHAAEGARKKAIVFGGGPWIPVLAGATAMLLIVGSFAFIGLRKEALLGLTASPSSARVAASANGAPAAAPQDSAEAQFGGMQPKSPESRWAERDERAKEAPPPREDGAQRPARRAASAAPKPPAIAAKSAMSEHDMAAGAPLGVGAASGIGQGAGAKARMELAAAPSGAASAPPSTSPSPSPKADAMRDPAPALIDRAELLARMGRCDDAVSLFSTILENGGPDPLLERALYGRGRCSMALGERDQGIEDLRAYLARFPDGRFATEAQRLLQ
jgi:hypothetical protein